MNGVRDIVIGLIELYETNDVFELCDYLNIEIIEKENLKFESYFNKNSYGDEFIYIDTNLDIKKKRELIAHELGHAILHTDLAVAYYNNSLLNKPKIEREANEFAAELLVQDEDLHSCIFDNQTVEELAYCLEVTKDVVKHKLNKE
jgi:Zn-dependent peptidase ImmA (M78 family)